MLGKTVSAPDAQLKQDIQLLCGQYAQYNSFDPELFSKFAVKRGLRNADGTGVLAGITQICNVHGYLLSEGEKVPIDGELTYRGYSIRDLIAGAQAGGRYCFEETAWLLLLGFLPDGMQLRRFFDILSDARALPDNFTEDMIMKAASPNIMNMLARSVLALYTYDPAPEDTSIENVMLQSIQPVSYTHLQHPHAADPMCKAAPIKQALRQRLHVRQNTRACRCKAGHRFEHTVDVAGDRTAGVKRDCAKQRNDQPYKADGHKALARIHTARATAARPPGRHGRKQCDGDQKAAHRQPFAAVDRDCQRRQHEQGFHDHDAPHQI